MKQNEGAEQPATVPRSVFDTPGSVFDMRGDGRLTRVSETAAAVVGVRSAPERGLRRRHSVHSEWIATPGGRRRTHLGPEA